MTDERNYLASGRIESKTAAQLSEFSLIYLDITDGIRALRIWGGVSQVGSDSESDHLIKTAMFRDAVGRFVECFEKAREGKNRSKKLRLIDAEVFSDSDGSLKYFEWLVGLRDSSIAHRHGRSRQHEIGVFYDPNTGAVAGISEISLRYAAPEPSEMEMLVRLFKRAADHASGIIDELQEAIDHEVAGMSLTDLLILQPTGLQAPSSTEMRETRSGRKRD